MKKLKNVYLVGTDAVDGHSIERFYKILIVPEER
jgi:hypothetical protein